MMDAFCDPQIEKVVIMSSSQIGKTEILLNVIGYFIDQDPCPILVVHPTVEAVKTWSKDRLSTMIRDTPCLKNKVFSPKAKSSDSTILHKVFKGGHITMVGANSAAGLAMRPVRVVLMDEVDRFPLSAGAEGDPCRLAEKRATTFWNRKIGIVSTPTLKGLSRVEKEYELSDKRRYFVPCPYCDHYQVLKFSQLKFSDDDPTDAVYICENCKKELTDKDKQRMLRFGKWIPGKETRGIAGFWLNELYSPWVSFANLASRYIEAKKSKETMKVFVNTALAETWEEEEEGEQIEDSELMRRREDYSCVPSQVAVLTAGVDIHEDRIEVLVIGWGKDEESWHIEHKILFGHVMLKETWEQLDRFLQKTYQHESGALMKITCTCVDSGYMTKKVYEFIKPRQTRRVYAIKGSNQPGSPLVARPRFAGKEKVKLFTIGVSTAKDMIFSRLKLQEFGAGYMHFNLSCDEEYFKQLTAEKAILKFNRGMPYREYVKIRPRNEILDLWVYNIAAYSILNPNIERILNEIQSKSNEIKQNQTNFNQNQTILNANKTIKKPFTLHKKRSSWVKGWK